MNGRELLEALSYIDEELLAASEAPVKKAHWRRWAALAACLAILILGTFSFRQMEKSAVTEGAADQCAPEAMMAMGTKQETTAAMESAAEEPMAATEDEAGAFDPRSNSMNDTCEVTCDEAPLLVTVMEVTENGFIAQLITDEAEALTVTVLFTEDAHVPTLEAGREYYITVASSQEDGTLWVSAVEPAQEG